jgi:FkbM family methyltransferase
MGFLRACAYKALSDSRLTTLVGRCFSEHAFDKFGLLQTPPGCSHSLTSGIVFGIYEYSERFLIRRHLLSNLDVVELGASIGIVSRQIMHQLDASRCLIAVEALPALAKLARRNISAAHPGRDYQLVEAAIAYGTKRVSFDSGAEHISARIANEPGQTDESSTVVKARRLLWILDHFNVGEFSLVMDIDGAEYALVAKDSGSLKRCRCLIAELHGTAQQKEMLHATLATTGLRLIETKHSVVAYRRD